jgi:hypothetical protein
VLSVIVLTSGRDTVQDIWFLSDFIAIWELMHVTYKVYMWYGNTNTFVHKCIYTFTYINTIFHSFNYYKLREISFYLDSKVSIQTLSISFHVPWDLRGKEDGLTEFSFNTARVNCQKFHLPISEVTWTLSGRPQYLVGCMKTVSELRMEHEFKVNALGKDW